MSTSKSSPGPKGSSSSAKKPPRNPLYISKRKTDGGLFYVRRLPQALIDAGVVSTSQPTVRIALGTKDWLTAQAKARQLSAAYDVEWARLRAALVRGPEGCAPANPRKLQPDDIPVLSRRLEALLLYADDIDRSRALTADEFDAYEEELNSQRKALRNANQRSDLAAVADEAIGFLEAEGLDCDESSPHWMSWLKAVLQAHLAALSRIASRLDGEAVDTPHLPPPVRGEDDLDDLDRALQYWQSKSQPQPKTVVEVRTAMTRFKEVTGRTRRGSRRVRMRSPSSFAASLLNASKRTSSGVKYPFLRAYPALATIVDVLPEPAEATKRTRSSKQITDLACSSVRGAFSTLSKKSRDRSSSWVRWRWLAAWAWSAAPCCHIFTAVRTS